MPGLTIHASNRLENLAEQLAESLRKPLAEPFAGEVIVVQSGGMARWLTFQLSHRLGVVMNIECPFPREFIGKILHPLFPEIESSKEYSADVLTWKIHRLLPALASRREFAPVRIYLDADDGLKRFQLSEKIARVFDDYIVYRLEMLMEWERSGESGDANARWQAMLWRELMRDGKSMSPTVIHEQLSERMGVKKSGSFLYFPERVSVFCISSLPPFYLRVFFEMSRQCDVRVFSLQPAQEYFGHDISPKQKARLAGKGVAFSDDTNAGNPLLTSLGRQHRDFIEVRFELDERAGHVAVEAAEQFVDPGDADMLRAVQSDILHARSREESVPKKIVAADDRTIQIHACHSPMREIEVLGDHLLALFDADASLLPRDIIVMTPDIEKYAPFIQAVFGCPENERMRIPFSIADRHPRSASQTVDTFLALLELAGSRCGAVEIFTLLEREPIRRRFGFTDDGMELIRRWIADSGIRWGIDAAHREQFGVPPLGTNTWCFGLDRLLLGYAMAGKNRRMFEGIMPCDDVEGNGAETLGRFISAAEALFRLVKELPVPRPLAGWPGVLGKIINDFFVGDTPDEANDLRALRGALDELRKVGELAGGDQEVDFRAIRFHLASLLDEGERRSGFLTGGVTFCALKPMRIVPARVICLVGMDDQAFPRQSHPTGFDLLAAARRCGDRSIRDEDRGIFLETLTSARERLFISFVGRSMIDNKEQPPSVLVSELLDYLDHAFEFPDEKKAREFVVIGHRLHAFSPSYFDAKEPRLFSYSHVNAAASARLRAPESPQPPFVSAPLSEPDAKSRSVELASLIEFFGNPAKYFMRRRLGVRLDENDETLEETEPFDLDELARFKIKQELVEHVLAGESAGSRELVARGVLPLGTPGEARFNTMHRDADAFMKKVEPELRGEVRDDPMPVDLRIGDFSLSGRVEPIYDGRIIHFRCAKLKAKDRLRTWISHLARCADAGGPIETVLIGVDASVTFQRVENARDLLAALLEIYWQGLTHPLPFFPESAFEFASADAADALKNARAKWWGSDFSRGECCDDYYEFCFGDVDPLNKEFTRLAADVFGPMLKP